jgi:uncharacterized membrane protein
MVSTGGYALVRALGVFVSWMRARRAFHAALFVVGLGTLFPLYMTGENGGAMVYKNGVGVARTQAPQVASPPAEGPTPPDTVRSAQSTPRSDTP